MSIDNANILGNLFNPYLQNQKGEFGGNMSLSPETQLKYNMQRGGTLFGIYPGVAYPEKAPPGYTLTKAGLNNNKTSILPKELVGFPLHDSPYDQQLKTDRVGLQLGQPDIYRDSPYTEWTEGIQYYTPYIGSNMKQLVPPVIAPPIVCPEVWATDINTFDQINTRYVQDITDLDMTYSCKSCSLPSASLGTPVFYSPQNPTAPLPVQNPGQYPNIGRYTTEKIGQNIRDWPQPVNPIVELQRRNMGFNPTPILPDMNNYTREIVQSGFSIN